MSISSANTEDLKTFVDGSDRAVGRLGDDLRSVRNLAASVKAASSFRYTETVSLDSTSSLREGWDTNASWVGVVRTELIASDRYDVDGNPIVSDRDVTQALQAAGLEGRPGAITCPVIEVFGEPNTSGFVDDPICLANGNFVLPEHDLSMYGLAHPIGIVRTYNSRDDRTGLFGHRWSSMLDSSLDITEHRVTHRGPDGGGAIHRRLADGGWSIDTRRKRHLRETDDGWAVDENRERTWFFDTEGTLTGAVDGTARIRVERTDDSITVVEERSGRSVRHVLDPDTGYITEAISSDGRTVTYRHDGDHLVGVERAVGDLVYETDEEGFLAACTDADGVLVFRNTYDPDGWVQSQIEPHGRETHYEYRPDGVATVTSTDGRPPNVMVHDRRGRMTAMIDGLGHVMRMAYDGRDNLVQLVDRTGAVTRFRHDDRGNVIERIDADGLTTRYEWDDLDRLVSETDRAGATIAHTYRGEQREPSRTRLPDGSEVVFDHDDHGLLLAVTDADGVPVRIERDDSGIVTAVLDRDGDVLVRLDHDGAGRVTEMVAGDRRAGAELDDGGRILAVTTPDGTHRFDHSAAGRLVGFAASSGPTWRYERDRAGDVTAIVDDTGVLARFERDDIGDVIAEIDAEGGRTNYERDPLGRETAVVDGTGNRTEYRYDAEGRIIETVDAAGDRYRVELDVLGRLAAAIDPSGTRTSFTHHPNGELASRTDAAGNIVRHEIDALGRTRSIIDPAGGETMLRYSSAGRLLEERSPAGRTVHNRYDDNGMLIGIIGPDGVEHDATAEPADRGGRFEGDLPESSPDDGASQFHHDPRGVLEAAIDPAGILTRFLSDDAGRLIETATGSVGMTYSWDAAGRLASITDPNGHRTTIHRGAMGGVDRLEHPDGTGLVIDRDVDGYLRRITDLAGTDHLDLARDPRGLITRVDDHDGTLHASYDVLGLLSELANDAGTIRFERDADGMLTGVVDDDHRITIELDVTASPISYRLDEQPAIPAPEPLAVTRDDDGRITIDENGRRYGYDLAGRLASTTIGDRTTTYDYDDLGLLATEHHPEGVRTHRHGAAGEILQLRDTDGTETTYLYDLLGRRIGEQHSDGHQRTYRWDSFGRLVGFVDLGVDGERRERHIERDPLGRPLRIGDTPIHWADPHGLELLGIGGERYVRHDSRIRVLTDPHGTWSRRVGDDPWGVDGGSGVRLGHRGHLAVDDLVLMGARVYDPASRSFLTRDPLPSIPGQVSFAGLYQYAWCDPVNHLDPTGRRPLSDEEYEQWREKNTKGWVRRNWKSIAVTAGAIVVGGVLTVVTAGAAAPLLTAVAIGATVGATAGVVDARVNGQDWGVAIRQGIIGGVVGGATAGMGHWLGNVARRGGSAYLSGNGGRVLDRIAETGFRRTVTTEVAGAVVGEGADAATAPMFGHEYQFDPAGFTLNLGMGIGGGMVTDLAVDRLGPTRPVQNPYQDTDLGGVRPSERGSLQALRDVPGVGDKLARRVLGTRNAYGGERLTYGQLLDIKGIGPDRAMKIMDAKAN